jgi:hypothetical protein
MDDHMSPKKDGVSYAPQQTSDDTAWDKNCFASEAVTKARQLPDLFRALRSKSQEQRAASIEALKDMPTGVFTGFQEAGAQTREQRIAATAAKELIEQATQHLAIPSVRRRT